MDEKAHLIEKGKERTESLLLENVITAFRRISCDVSEGPNSLFSDVEDGRREEFDEDWDGSRFNNDLSVFRSTRSDVGESPGGFELYNQETGQ